MASGRHRAKRKAQRRAAGREVPRPKIKPSGEAVTNRDCGCSGRANYDQEGKR
jgi:hypothetical protein